MDQSKEPKGGIFHSLKQRFWPSGITTRSCFKKRGTKIKLKSGSNHCNLSVRESDNFYGSPNNSPGTTELNNILSVSEPAIPTQINVNENIIENNSLINHTLNDQLNGSREINVDNTHYNSTNTNTMCCSSITCTSNTEVSLRPHDLSPILQRECSNLDSNNENVQPNTQQTDTDHFKSGLMCELVKLSKYGWYWGAMTKEEAEEKLTDQPDGAFLLRDSSADHFILSLSFRSSGKTLHTRIEYNLGRGQFSFYQQADESFASIGELIEHCMSYSQSAIYCYSRSRSPGIPAFPVRLTKPVSRFAQIRSLQHLCRFVIRETIRLDNIQKLPLPRSIKGYLEEGHY